MNAYYYSQLDFINKNQFTSALQTRNFFIERLEISLGELEIERLGGDVELEMLLYFFCFFNRSPKITISNRYDQTDFKLKNRRKIEVYNAKRIFKIVTFLSEHCHVLNQRFKLVRRNKQAFSVKYEVKLDYIKHYMQLPNALIRCSQNEIPKINVEFFFKNDCDVKYLEDIFSFLRIPYFEKVENPLV